jgi:hypothetical protein
MIAGLYKSLLIFSLRINESVLSTTAKLGILPRKFSDIKIFDDTVHSGVIQVRQVHHFVSLNKILEKFSCCGNIRVEFSP